jgi:hypothetical protein
MGVVNTSSLTKRVVAALMIALLSIYPFYSLPTSQIPPLAREAQAQSSAQEQAMPVSLPVGLYIGGTNPGVVYKYVNGTLTQISPILGFSVTSIVYFDGKLYVGVITSPYSYESRGLVYRMDDNGTWTLIGELDNQVCFLIGYKGHLYAGTGIGSARLYRYVPESQSWIKIIEYPSWYGFRSAYVWKDWLYLGDWLYDKIARWNGTAFEDLGYYGGSCIYCFEDYGDYLYAGAYMGSLYRISYDPPRVERVWQEPDGQYIWALREYGGYLYIGTAWNEYGTQEGRLYRYNGTHIELVWSKPVSYRHEGIISLMTDGPHLFVGVGGQAVGYPGSPEKGVGAHANVTQVYPFYMPASGVGQVWQYDGESFRLIVDSLGTGVQSILPNTLFIPFYVEVRPSGSILIILGGYVVGKVISATIATLMDKNCDGKITWGEFLANLGEEFTTISLLDIATLAFSTMGFGPDKLIKWGSEYLFAGSEKILARISPELVKYLYVVKESKFIKFLTSPAASTLLFPAFKSIVKYSTYNPATHEYFLGKPILQIGIFKVKIWSPPEVTCYSIVQHEDGGRWVTDYFSFGTAEKKVITSYGRVDLQVTDQHGRVTNKTVNQIPGSSYVEADFNGDGELDDRIVLPEVAGLFYNVSVIPEPASAPNDTYTLVVESAGVSFSAAKDVPISEIPRLGYALSSEVPPTEIPPMISVKLAVIAKAFNISDSVTFGVASNATEGFDVVFDEVKQVNVTAPYLNTYFYYPDNPAGFQMLSTSYVNLTEHVSWPLRIEYNGSSTVLEISWNITRVNMFPPDYRLLLHTPEGILIDMRSGGSYTFNATCGVYSFNITAVKTGLVRRTFSLHAGMNTFSIPLFLCPSDLAVQMGEVYPLSVFSYDRSARAYITVNTSEVGGGYWIKVPSNVIIEVVGYPVPATPFVISLRPGWNLIGHPFEQPVSVSSLQVFNPATGETLSFKDAVARGWIYRNLYWYDPVTHRYTIIPPFSGILEPFRAYWVKAYTDVRLIIPRSQ